MRLIWVPFDWNRPRITCTFPDTVSVQEAERSFRPFGEHTRVYRNVSKKKWKRIRLDDPWLERPGTVLSVMEIPPRLSKGEILLGISFDFWAGGTYPPLPIFRLFRVDSNTGAMETLQKKISERWSFVNSQVDDTIYSCPFRIRKQKVTLSDPCPLWNMGGFKIKKGKIEWDFPFLSEQSRKKYCGCELLSFSTSYHPLVLAMGGCLRYSRENAHSRALLLWKILQQNNCKNKLVRFLRGVPGFRNFFLREIFSYGLPLLL